MLERYPLKPKTSIFLFLKLGTPESLNSKLFYLTQRLTWEGWRAAEDLDRFEWNLILYRSRDDPSRLCFPPFS
jgi:hypothetical protein